jgi:hypothetical protein
MDAMKAFRIMLSLAMLFACLPGPEALAPTPPGRFASSLPVLQDLPPTSAAGSPSG